MGLRRFSFKNLRRINASVASVAILTIIVAIALAHSPAMAQTVRGRLIRGGMPAAGIGVNLMYTDASGHRIQTGLVLSAPDGTYLIYNVPPRDYLLQVWDQSNPLRFNIHVYPQQWVDIAPIHVR